jgi:Mlc titration factor MtfA (ptsG expression regulator)
MVFGLFRALRRRRLKARPLPPAFEEVVERRFPFVAQWPGPDRDTFFEHLKLFVWEKNFEGIGMEITDEIKVIIAAQAARLSRKVGFQVYDKLSSILVYAEDFQVPGGGQGPSGVDVHSDARAVRGVAHPFGSVALSWDAVEEGLSRPYDGRDTTLHELAHIIDHEDGAFDGTPLLDRQQDYESWILACSTHFERLRKKPRKSILRSYGATNEAEFFAVATEYFFERPDRMKQKAPDLYKALADFFGESP